MSSTSALKGTVVIPSLFLPKALSLHDVFAVRIAAGIHSLNTFSLLRFYHFIKVIYFHRSFTDGLKVCQQ